MRAIQVREVMSFDELSESSKSKAIESRRYYFQNIDHACDFGFFAPDDEFMNKYESEHGKVSIEFEYSDVCHVDTERKELDLSALRLKDGHKSAFLKLLGFNENPKLFDVDFCTNAENDTVMLCIEFNDLALMDNLDKNGFFYKSLKEGYQAEHLEASSKDEETYKEKMAHFEKEELRAEMAFYEIFITPSIKRISECLDEMSSDGYIMEEFEQLEYMFLENGSYVGTAEDDFIECKDGDILAAIIREFSK